MAITTTICMAPDVTRTSIDERNIYDGHHNIRFLYRFHDRLVAVVNATGYPWKNEYNCISSLRPPHAGTFSNGKRTAYFKTLDEMDAYILSEIEKSLAPYE